LPSQKPLVRYEFDMMRVFGTVMKSSVDGNETQTVKEAKHFMNIENIPRKYPGLYDVIEKTGGTF